ncbi:uncharacterized protein METZ01_LOCUS362396, partial [marine metagenome]
PKCNINRLGLQCEGDFSWNYILICYYFNKTIAKTK